MTSKPLNIYQRLNEVMKTLDYLQKGGKGDGLKYSFVSHDKVTAALHEPFVQHGIMLIPSADKITQEGTRTCVQMSIQLVNIDDPSDRIVIQSVGYGIDSQDKGPGKAISYAVKYALLKLLMLETGDDPDNDQHTEFSAVDPHKAPPAPVAVTPETLVDNVNKLVAALPDNEAKLMSAYMKDLKVKMKKLNGDVWMDKLNVELLARLKNPAKFKQELIEWNAKKNKEAADLDGLPF